MSESFDVFPDRLDIDHFNISPILDFSHHFFFGLSKMLLDMSDDLFLEDAIVFFEFPEYVSSSILADHLEIFFSSD